MSGEVEKEARLAILMSSTANQLTEENGEWCWLEIASAVMAATPSDADRTAVVEECARVAKRVGDALRARGELAAACSEVADRIEADIRRISTPAGEDRS